MRKVLDFLDNLQNNNDRLWFEAHKKEYLEAKSVFNSFAEKLIAGISEFDPLIRNLTVNDCTYRIYRDIRFSKDKSPYKTHMGVFIAPNGKNGGYSGYYFHIEAKNANYIGSHILSAGIYCPDPKVVKSIREEIMLNGRKFNQAIEAAGDRFVLDSSNKLKKIPQGFPPDSEYAEFFKYKDYFLSQDVDDAFILSEDLLDNTLREFRKTLPFNNLLNKAAGYAYGVDIE